MTSGLKHREGVQQLAREVSLLQSRPDADRPVCALSSLGMLGSTHDMEVMEAVGLEVISSVAGQKGQAQTVSCSPALHVVVSFAHAVRQHVFGGSLCLCVRMTQASTL